MKVIQELVAHFDRQGKLSRKEIKGLLDQGLLAADAPARIMDLCDQLGNEPLAKLQRPDDPEAS